MLPGDPGSTSYYVTQDGCIHPPNNATVIIISAPRHAKICADSNIPDGCLIKVEAGAVLEIDGGEIQGYAEVQY